ncbi:uncharacterized protein LOC127878658 [Dreissena polymorpha]|uniref:uncharacterized protein LOC127878658 n=1 Tax=Dreissena polymorpha TaxID=45954 RepID=UPI002263EE71|nr:uncharacterized protein LOC127878658 [Dreissena polymorpha]
MHARLGWMICGALAVTVINWLMTHLDPVWFHHNVKETHLTRPVSQSWLTSSQTAGKVHSSISPVSENWLTSPQTAGKVHQPGSQKWHTIPRTTEKGVYQDIGVKRLDPIIYSEACSGTINDSRRNTFFNDYVKVQHYLDDLFGSMADINALSKDADPVFISDASSNHFRESMDMFNNFNSVVRKMKPNLRMIFYDLDKIRLSV